MITLWLACSTGSSVQTEGTDSIPSVVIIPSGTYPIGPADGITVPHTFQRSVTLTYSFAIQTTEVTYSQWLEVTPDLPDQYCDSDLRQHAMSPRASRSMCFLVQCGRVCQSKESLGWILTSLRYDRYIYRRRRCHLLQ